MQLHNLVRYVAVLDLIRERVNGGALLDVGSAGLTVGTYLSPAWSVTAVEVGIQDDVRQALEAAGATVVEADARSLPFPDRSFDVVVALDLMEHIPNDARRVVVAEFARVARHRVIVAGPAGPAARRLDARMARWLDRREQPWPVWLQEHTEYGLPSVRDLAGPLAGPIGDFRVRVVGNANVTSYWWMLRAVYDRPGWHAQDLLTRASAPALRADGGRMSRVLLSLLAGFHLPPRYRAIIVADRLWP